MTNANLKDFLPLSVIKYTLLVFFLVHLGPIYATPSSMNQAKIKLNQVEGQIRYLQQTLDKEQSRQQALQQTLVKAEKKISVGVKQLHITQQAIAKKQLLIQHLKEQMTRLNQELHDQETLLAQHIRARYAMGEYQPLKWVLNQDNPEQHSRLLTLYQYVIASRQQVMHDLTTTKATLTQTEQVLHQELQAQQALQQQLAKNQHQLEVQKQYEKEILQSIHKGIQSKRQQLVDYERNKNNLANLIKTLITKSEIHYQHQRAFSFMNKKLPQPVVTNNKQIKRINQGVVFFAGEGTEVHAVSPGKVVFSNWLNGYGLLIILDHGRGFMTLYAHNQSLFKQAGDNVKQGEQIATVGHSGGLKQNGLYFEIRHLGKAISPTKWLS